ncbi:hypothetical protein PTH_2268 [Pelotomaculum thermopropionicum SI]|uniref:N-acetyltransferase domain-containing protein n=1 Tax=Pelotomaculum thermopropionicum (strain DSM 13744 / JCM 10971 / SI) TaxID=370438 RepID=A5CZY6_PELTS|nr:hypothetical protein PTH_2268 [Pelotomaculum thermopropionicum SI]
MLKNEVLPVSGLAEADVSQMYELMLKYYSNLDPGIFRNDLNEKDHVLLFREDDGTIAGFTSSLIIRLNIAGVVRKLLYSGDTVMDRKYWGMSHLQNYWFTYISSLPEFKEGDFYWLLLSKGYRTYRFLPYYFNLFWPRYDAPTPPLVKAMIEGFANLKFPDVFDRASGIIRSGCDYVKPGVADMEERHLQDLHIEYFARVNPGYVRGDELVCVAELSYRGIKDFVHQYFV